MHRLSIILAAGLLFSFCKKSGSDNGSGTGSGSGGSTPYQTSAQIGAAGGTISDPNGNWTLTIPAGALMQAKTITVTTNAKATGSVPDEFTNTSPTLSFEPHGLTFLSDATLKVKYAQGDMSEGGIEEKMQKQYYINDDSKVTAMTSTVNTATNEITAQIPHFSFSASLTSSIKKVNNGTTTRPSSVRRVANRLIAYFNSLGSDAARNAEFQANSALLNAFIQKLVQILGSDILTAAFPNADFNNNGIPNSSDPLIVVGGASVTLTSSGSLFVSTNAGAIGSTQFIWRSSASGTYAIRLNGTNCTDGTLVQGGAVTLNVDNTVSGINASALLAGDNEYRICVTVGATTTFLIVVIARDEVYPVSSASPAGGTYTTAQNVSMSCLDTGDADCAQIAYTTNGTDPTFDAAGNVTNGTLVTGMWSSPGSGTTTLKVRSRDEAGNVGATVSYTFIADLPPTYSVTPISGSAIPYLTEIEIVFSKTVTGASTAANYALSGAGIGSAIVTKAVNTTGNTYRIYFSGTISTGNVSITLNNITDASAQVPAANVITYTGVEGNPPLTTADHNGGAFTSSQVVNLSCSDADSGCQKIVYTTNGTVPTFTPVNGTVIMGNSAGPIVINAGETRLRYAAMDNAGNVEPFKEKIFQISTSGFTFVASGFGLARGVGLAPATYVNISYPLYVNAIFRDPVNGRMYLSAYEGMYISTDGGATWIRRNPGGSVAEAVPVYGVYARGDMVYVATFGKGLAVSRDGGATFTTTYSAGTYLKAVYVVDNVVYVGRSNYMSGSGGISTSLDGGVNFDYKNEYQGIGYGDVNDIQVVGSKIYLATNGGLTISTDGGANYTNYDYFSGIGLGSGTYYATAIVGSDIYVATSGGVSISTNGGVSYVTRTTANGLGSNTVTGIYVSGGIIYAANYGLSISTDGGTSFSTKTAAHGLGNTNVRSVFAHGGSLYAGTGAGFSISTNGGSSFSNITPNSHWGTGVVYGIHVSGTNVYASLQDGGLMVSTNLGNTFSVRTTAQGLGANYVSKTFSAGGYVYAAGAVGLGVSNDSGATFTNKTTANGLGSNGTYSAMSNGSTVYVGTFGGLSVSTDNGTSFANRTTANGLGHNMVNSVYVVGSTVYAGTGNYGTSGGVSISTDSGASFSNKTTSNGLGHNHVFSVFASGSNVYAATEGGLAISTDGGGTFTNKTTSNGLPGNIIYGVSVYGGTIFACTNVGLGISTDGGASFVTKGVAHGLATSMTTQVAYVP
ncbi:MAG: chitobiase/beta-hexosaminidase C-terminal domain-containing protein [Turneriella sp.]